MDLSNWTSENIKTLDQVLVLLQEKEDMTKVKGCCGYIS